MKQLKKFTALLLAICMICGVLPATAWAATGEPTIVIAGSDYQNTNGNLFSSGVSTDAYAIMSRIKEDYDSVYGFLFGGDYYAHTTNTTTESTNGKKQLKEEIVDVLYPDMADDNQIYIQGNHDADSLTTNGTLATSGAHDTNKYGVYVINEKDYMWYNDDQSTIKSTASALDSYLDAKVNENYNKPIFVLSHLPLHYSTRTVGEGDGKYAKYIYDVLDEAGNNGLNIIFMYGHNHSTTYYEAYLGNAAVYLAEGDTIYVANEGSRSSCFSDTLSFTYMNYGFTGYLSNSTADGDLTMTVFEIYEDEVQVKRYDESGIHNLKSAGVATNMPSGVSANTTVYTSPQSITLTTPAVASTYLSNGVTVTAPGLTGLTATKNFGTSSTDKYDSGVCSAYASYGIDTEGFVTGNTATITITLDSTDGFSDSEKVVIINQTTGEEIEKEIVNGTVTFTATNDGVFNVAQYKYVEIEVPVTSNGTTEGTIWRQVNSFTAGKKYMLVNYGENASGIGTYAINSTAGPTGVTVQTDSEGAFIENSDMALGWLATANGSQHQLTNADTGYYLYATTYGSTSGVNLTVGQTAGTYSNWSMELNANTDSALSARNSGGSNNYYPVRYSNGGTEFLAYTSTQTSKYDNWVVIFELTSEGSSSSTVTTSGGDWVTITAPTGGTTTYTYTQATSITAGEEYVIVGNNNAVALMDNNGSMGSQSVTISGTTMTSTTELTEWTFSGSSSGTIYNGTRYLRYSSSSFSLSTSSSTDFTITDNGSNFRIQSGNYSFYYNGSSWTRSGRNTAQYVRLYKLTDTTTTGGTNGLFAKIDGNLTYTVTNGTSVDDALAAVMTGITGYTNTTNSGTGTALADSALTWTLDSSYDGTTPGEYAVTISYNNKVIGVAKVVVPEQTGTTKLKVYTDSSSGTVKQNAKSSATTGTTLTIIDAEGNVIETVKVTLDMLKDDDGNAVSTATIGSVTGLNIYYTYNGVGYLVFEDYTLNVVENIQNNYPDYPNEGAVKVNKTATGIDFQSSGIAQVELSVSGVPSKKGVDVIVMVDTSSSMKRGEDTGNDNAAEGEQRIDFLQAALANLITQFQAVGDDGEQLDIRVAIAEFNGYTHIATNQTLSGTSVQTSSNVAEVFTGDKTISANAFVQAASITNPTTFASNIGAHSGTNYDYAFDTIYRLGAAITAENEANSEERDLTVIFMSDGAPYQYNYYGSQTVDEWNDYLLGTINTSLLGGSYTCFYNEDGDHWMAEAIKGDTSKTYQVIDPTKSLGTDADVSGDGNYFRMVPGLGAEIHTIGFCLYDDDVNEDDVDVVYEETQQTVMQNLASVDSYGNVMYHETKSGSDLNDIFCEIASEIAYAANNAYFLDQMGDAFDLQLATVNYAPEGSTEKTENITPVIEVKSYDIYTRQDYLDGLCQENQIGDRKGTYTVIETVTFNTDGTEAYSSLIDVDGDGIYGDDNILGEDGVIYAKNFAYNTTLADITVNGVTVAAESFYWYVGTVTTTELAISYYVYLTGSMEGTREAGSYATNNYATLYYENYLGNDCYKDTTSPTIAWESALVRYAFYLVDSNGNPVNNNGSIVTFANKVAVTQPVIYQEILLNNLENVNSIEVASLANLPEGYTLYDEAAKYTITINSNSTGSWEIVNGKTVATTYVMQYDPSNTSAYSNELTKDSNAYDYTHTVVWFAVVWTPQCVPDTVVIDYGLPVDIHVLSNDMFGDYGKLIGVTEETVTGSTIGDATNQITDDEATGIYGTVKAITTDDNGNALDKDDSVIRYTPSSMEMNSYDTFTYSVNYAGTENAGYYYGTVTVIPATSIYYEDNYVTYSVWNQSNLNKISDDWSTEGETINATQAEDRPGQYSLSSVDANNLYGYDAAYSSCATYSMGSAKKVTVNAQQYAQATFSFYGTGFDVISLTSNTTGTITVAVKSEDGQVTRNLIVDTYYGYKYVETTDANGVKTGAWVVDENADKALYQVPVMKVTDLPYGKYNVTITAAYLQGFDHRTDGTVDEEENPVKSEYDFYLDAIRIYDPANDGAADATIANAYKADGEGWPSYVELRNQIIKAGSFDDVAGETLPESTPGLVFIDGDASVGDAQIDDYIDYGPNNEIYIAPGQRIAFMLEIPENIAGVHIGIKSADGEVGTYTITNIAKDADEENNITAGTWYGAKTYTINTTTDMYYDLSGWKNDIIVISNTGDRYSTDGVISITNIKFTYTSNPKASSGDDNGIETAGVYMTRSAAMLTLRTINTSVETETTIPEVTVPETEGTMSGSTTDSTVSDIVGSSTSENATGTSSENVSNETTSDNSVSNDVVTDTEENIAEDEETDTVEENADTKDTMSFFGYIVAIIKDIFKAIAELFAGLV